MTKNWNKKYRVGEKWQKKFRHGRVTLNTHIFFLAIFMTRSPGPIVVFVYAVVGAVASFGCFVVVVIAADFVFLLVLSWWMVCHPVCSNPVFNNSSILESSGVKGNQNKVDRNGG